MLVSPAPRQTVERARLGGWPVRRGFHPRRRGVTAPWRKGPDLSLLTTMPIVPPTEPRATPVALRARGLVKRYGRSTTAIRSLDVELRAGTSTALVGPNGAGKSTLIKAWVGFERPTHGTVEVCGIDPWRRRSLALSHVAYVPQTTALYWELTVDEHLDLAGTLRPSFDRNLAARRLGQLAIPLTAPARLLSGGQRAQLGLALALGTRADVLLLDEPLASLDPLARREFLHVVRDSARADGTTVLLSSHVITDLEHACDHIVVLGSGSKLLDMPTAEALATHEVVPGAGPAQRPDRIIGQFHDAVGQPMMLLRRNGGGDRGASLEEIVLGYLSSARAMRSPQ